MKKNGYQTRGNRWLETFWQDVRYGVRMLHKNSSFTFVAVLTLALAIGANTAIFSIVDKLLWRTLPVAAPQQLVLLTSESVNPRFLSTIFSYPDYLDYRDRNQVFSGLIAFSQIDVRLEIVGAEPERVTAELVSGNFFDVLGIGAARGRTFLAEEDRAPGSHPVIVMSYNLWQQRFGAAPDIVGRTVTLGESRCTVIGVAPRDFTGMHLERPAAFWAPLAMEAQLASSPVPEVNQRYSRWLNLIGRLKSGMTTAQAQAAMHALAQGMREEYTPQSERNRPFYEQRILLAAGGAGISILRRDMAQTLTLLMAVVGLILLIACANIANLLVARSAARRKEIAVRLALGAGRLRLVRQLLVESTLLALVGGAVGLLFAPWLTKLLLAFTAGRIDFAQTSLQQTLDVRVVLFTLLVSVLSGIAFGLVPALGTSAPDLTSALKEAKAVMDGRARRMNAGNLLVIAQIALSLVVLTGAGLFVKSLRTLLAIDPGFKAAHVVVAPIDLPAKKYDEARGREFFRQLAERVATLPGVEDVSTALVVPVSGSKLFRNITVEGYKTGPGEDPAVDTNQVGPRYHQVMGIPIVRGRGFTEHDRMGAPRVAVINEAMARLYFAGQDPLGKRLWLGRDDAPAEIVGVARDSKYHSLTETSLPHFDTPSLQEEEYGLFATLHIGTKGDATSLIASVRREVMALDPTLPIASVRTLREELSHSLAAVRMAAALTSLFGVAAMLLAAIGVYGVMSYAVTRRTHEIGLRMALGASRTHVLGLVIGRGLRLAVAGIGLGLLAAFAATRIIANMLYGVEATDPVTFAGVAALLSCVALLACYIPARRAAKVDPLVALRHE